MFDQIEALLRKHEVKKAEKLIAKALRSGQEDAQARLLVYRARTRLFNGRPESGLDDLTTARQLNEALFNDPKTLEVLADCYFGRFELSAVGFADRSDTQQAESLYRTIIQQFSTYQNLGWVYYQLGRVLLSAARVDEAVTCLQQALLSPSQLPALTAYCYERLGFIAFYEQREPQRALHFLDKVIDTYPIAAERSWLVQVYILRSRVWREMRDVNHALQDSDTALQIATMGRNRVSLGEALLTSGELLAEMRGRERDLIDTLERFLQISKRPPGMDVTWSRAYEMLADAYTACGEYEKAISAYYSVLAYNPYHPWEVSIYYRIGRAYYRKGSYEKAIDAIRHAIKLAEDNPSLIDYRVHDTYGSALFALGHFQEASQAYEQALNLLPVDHEHSEKIRHYHQLALEKLKLAL